MPAHTQLFCRTSRELWKPVSSCTTCQRYFLQVCTNRTLSLAAVCARFQCQRGDVKRASTLFELHHYSGPRVRFLDAGTASLCNISDGQTFRCRATELETVVAADTGRGGVESTAGAPGELLLYNTMSRSKALFQPREGQGARVSMYVCGVTVYDYSHIGHARVYVTFDVLYRLLHSLGYTVHYVRNFTDIDDKIIKRASEKGEDWAELSRRFAQEFHADMDALGCLRPSCEPRATEYIPQMQATIQRILQHGHAYQVDGDVFFDVNSLPGYGRLAGRVQDDNRAGERVAVDGRKKDPADFALWKSVKEGGGPSWSSPWGPGRPGWHIECSTMIREEMGPVIDIHGGGRDLVFPHHENELAQSQAAACCCDQEHMVGGTDFVRWWVHNGFVNVDSEKMSKSLGNFFTIREVTALYHPMSLRWFLLTSHYRQPINYSQRALEEASDRLFYLYQSVADTKAALAAAGDDGAAALEEGAKQLPQQQGPGAQLLREGRGALLDDLNSPAAVAALSGPLKTMNDLLHTKKGKKAAKRLSVLASNLCAMQQLLELLGMWVEDAEKLLHELRELALIRAGLSEAQVLSQLAERDEARKAKDFSRSDAIRESLSQVGIAIMDAPTGTSWRPTLPKGSEEEERVASP